MRKQSEGLRVNTVMIDERNQDNDSIRVADAQILFNNLHTSTTLDPKAVFFIGEVDVHPLVLFPTDAGRVAKMMKK